VTLIGIVGSLLVTVGIGLAETVTVPPCGNTPGTTSDSYSGLVTITISGTMVNTPGNPTQDAFYALSVDDPTVSAGACPDCMRYNRASEGTCLCGFECPATSHALSGIVVGPYPAFDPTHVYTVTLDLGSAAPDRLDFAPYDCGCFDNTGGFTVVIPATPTTTSTTTSTTTTTIPPDADGDGVLDANEPCICLGTPPGVPVTVRGCSVDQACPCAAPLGRAKWTGHKEYLACVTNTLQELKLAGIITSAQRTAILYAATVNTCGG
jgi:hypothetical protein